MAHGYGGHRGRAVSAVTRMQPTSGDLVGREPAPYPGSTISSQGTCRGGVPYVELIRACAPFGTAVGVMRPRSDIGCALATGFPRSQAREGRPTSPRPWAEQPGTARVREDTRGGRCSAATGAKRPPTNPVRRHARVAPRTPLSPVYARCIIVSARNARQGTTTMSPLPRPPQRAPPPRTGRTRAGCPSNGYRARGRRRRAPPTRGRSPAACTR